ncbi:hypothetical protein [Streptomyces endophyticus]|uniref:Secreted protein n=1 Tax=Streptomyces endophyticus TaxID=714166 RepID=A0ABU6F1Y6_9ACTN|nr:hypothetical protein [Streptomyces endophyticus]MEB8338013.1 hypothetical protein [Streptomyces endophyticus]
MKKIISVAGLALAVTGLAAPAHADSNLGSGVGVSDDWNSSSAVTCLQEVAVAPMLGDYAGDHANNCSDGHLIGPGK